MDTRKSKGLEVRSQKSVASYQLSVIGKSKLFTAHYSLLTIFCLLLTVYCISIPSSASCQDFGIKFVFAIEKFYQDRLDTPMGIFVDKKRQELYVADSGRNEVLIFDLKGAPVFKFGNAQGVSNPFDLVVKDGLIYLAQEGKSYIEVFNYRGESIRRIAPPQGITFTPGRMAIDEDGSLYVINKDKTNCMVFDSQDRFVRMMGKGLSSLAGIAVSKDRVYLMAPFGDRAVQVYDKEGNFITAFEGLQDQGGTLGLPTSAMIDKDGLLWLVDSLRGIVVYDQSNKEISRFSEYGTAKGQLFFPVDIDFNTGDMVYITEKGAKRISVFKKTRK